MKNLIKNIPGFNRNRTKTIETEAIQDDMPELKPNASLIISAMLSARGF